MKRITTTITDESYEYIKKRGFNFSSLINQKVNELLEAENSGDLLKTRKEMLDRIERLSKIVNKMSLFIEKNGLSEKMIKESGL